MALLKLRITHRALMEIEPMMDDVRSDLASGRDVGINHDDGYGELVLAIDAGKRVKGGVMVTLDTLDAVYALHNEADFREDHLRDQMSEAWDNSDKMTFLGVAQGFKAIKNKCAVVIRESRILAG